MVARLLICLLLASSLPLSSCAALEQFGIGSGQGGGLTEERVAAGLREALTVGTSRAVERTGRTDGFLRNALIKIVIPSELTRMMNTLKDIGLTRQVNEFEVAMNRAAELAAAEAVDVFVEVVRGLTIQDAFSILNGHETAATDLFRDRTTTTLASRFRPIVQRKMREVNLYNAYNYLAETYAALPFTPNTVFDVETYVVDRALNGLFTTLGQEEAKIRGNVRFRTTDLLREVFGTLDRR